MLYLLFFLLKDGPYLVRQILDSLPLSDFAKQHLFAKFVGVSRATVKGRRRWRWFRASSAGLPLPLPVSTAACSGAH
jgi:hypothetical protein